MKHWFIVILIALSVLACQKNETATSQSETPTETAAAATAGEIQVAAEKTHTMTGTLVWRNAATNEVTIDNDEVPGGVMSKMVMAYELRGGKVDELPADGTTITSTLHEQSGNYWVTDVKAAQ